jgi:hypothetical protein
MDASFFASLCLLHGFSFWALVLFVPDPNFLLTELRFQIAGVFSQYPCTRVGSLLNV